MSEVETLLPPNATRQERAIEAAITRSLPIPLRDTWNPKTCPAGLLPWLAWAFSVDEWGADWSEEAKRTSIAESVQIHRKKGTPWAVKRVLAAAGYGDARLIEGNGANSYDGQAKHNEQITHGDPAGWARYRFSLARPIKRAEGARVRAILESAAPARCHLIDLNFTDAQFYNGRPLYDGEYAHGAA